MSVESYINAMPKAELGLQLEGAAPKQTLVMIAERNEIAGSTKGFADLVKQIDNPNYEKLPELAVTVSQWLRHADDLSRLVYDVGVALSKQNVRYAELGVNPFLYMGHTGMTFEQFADALEEGRDKAARGWKTQLQFILNVPREEPRRADDTIRWALSATGRKSGIIGVGLSGREEAQHVSNFERAFKAADKKGCPRIVHAGDKLGAEGTLDAIQTLAPTRIIGGWQTADAPDVIQLLNKYEIPLDICMARQLCFGRIVSYADYPLRHVYDSNLKITLTAHMPTFYKTSTSDEYLALVEHNDFTLEELEDIALNAVRYSLLSNEAKAELLQSFQQSYAELREEHVAQETS